MTRLASDVEAQVKQKLFEANYADSTLKKYRASVARFMSWVDDNKVPYSELDTAAGVDDLACRYISWLFAQSDGDSGKSVASTLLSALVAASPHLEGKLVLAAKMSRGWLRLQPAVAYPPLSWELTLVIAYQMKRAGKPLFALATLLGFDCFLRNGEIVNLQKADVADTGDVRQAHASRGLLTTDNQETRRNVKK